MSKVSEALEPWVYDPMYKGDDQPDQPHPEEGHTGNSDCCNDCDYWESRVDLMIDNQIKEAKLEKLEDRGMWVDPVGGIHYDDEDDPAKQYE